MTFKDQISSIVKLWIRAHGPLYKKAGRDRRDREMFGVLPNDAFEDLTNRMVEQVEAGYQKGLEEGKVALRLYSQMMEKRLRERGEEKAASIMKAWRKRQEIKEVGRGSEDSASGGRSRRQDG